MKRIAPAIALFAACCLAATASAHGASAPPCTPKKATVDGKPVFEFCGPATAALRVGGRAYTFRNGYCQMRTGTATLELYLGTLPASPKGNGGRPLFHLTAEHFGGTVFSAGGTVSASYAGTQLVNDLTKNSGHFPNQGSFKALTKKVTGTWNCHGVVYHGP